MPETSSTIADLVLHGFGESSMILRVAVKLIYQMFTKLLSWVVLHARSETANEIEILAYAINSPSYSDAHRDHGSAGPTAP